MITVNHAATGAAIALVIKEPALVIPLAFASHFLLDAFPHYGYERAGYEELYRHKLSYIITALEVALLIILLWLSWGESWLFYTAAFAAILPDLAWPYRYFMLERRGLSNPGHGTALDRFHNRIQWCERPWGILFEIVWLGFITSIIYALI